MSLCVVFAQCDWNQWNVNDIVRIGNVNEQDAEEAKLFYRVQVHWNIFLRHDIVRLLPKIGNYEFDILCVLGPIFVDSNYDVVGFRVISSELSSQVRDILRLRDKIKYWHWKKDAIKLFRVVYFWIFCLKWFELSVMIPMKWTKDAFWFPHFSNCLCHSLVGDAFIFGNIRHMAAWTVINLSKIPDHLSPSPNSILNQHWILTDQMHLFGSLMHFFIHLTLFCRLNFFQRQVYFYIIPQ